MMSPNLVPTTRQPLTLRYAHQAREQAAMAQAVGNKA